MANYANSANAASSKASLLAFQLASSTSFDSEAHRKFAMYDADFGRKRICEAFKVIFTESEHQEMRKRQPKEIKFFL